MVNRDKDQDRNNHRPANQNRGAVFEAVTPAPQPMAPPKDPQHRDATDKVGTFLNAARTVWILLGICCAAITSIEIANANAASMKVSSRVISIPRKRNPRNRCNESRSAGNADAMSRWRSFICRKSYATQCHVCKDFLTSPKLPRDMCETLTSPLVTRPRGQCRYRLACRAPALAAHAVALRGAVR
jgi:hypothetical protein